MVSTPFIGRRSGVSYSHCCCTSGVQNTVCLVAGHSKCLLNYSSSTGRHFVPGWMFPNPCVKALSPNVMVLGVGAFEREVQMGSWRWGSSGGISVLIRRGRGMNISPSCSHAKERPYKDIRRKWQPRLSPVTSWYLDLELPTSRIVRDKRLLFKPTGLWNLYKAIQVRAHFKHQNCFT